MKLFGIMLFVLCFCSSFAWAAGGDLHEDDVMYADLLKKRLSVPDTETYLVYLKTQLSKMQTMTDDEIKKSQSDEFWEKRVNNLPEQYKEYYIPSLFTNSAVPKTFLKRPEIKKYKNRIPRNIAPEVRDIVDRYGKDISPDYYYLLMPETYKKMNMKLRSDIKSDRNNVSGNIELRVKAPKNYENKSKVSEYIKSKMDLIDQNIDFIKGKINSKRSGKVTSDSMITNADVSDFVISLKEMNGLAFNTANKEKKKASASSVKEKNDDFCSFYIYRLSRAGKNEDAEKIMAVYKFDPESWQNICKRIFKILPKVDLNLHEAHKISLYSRIATFFGKKMDEYRVDLDDFKAVYPYRSQLLKTLKENGVIFDFYHKKGELAK